MVLWKEVWNWIWRTHLTDEFQWFNAENDEVISGTLIRMKRAPIRSSTDTSLLWNWQESLTITEMEIG